MSRLLLIDDDRAIRDSMSLALHRYGHDVVTVPTGEDGLRSWRARRPDLVLLDVMLPGIDGFDVCRAIRGTDQTPVIMLTARDESLDVVVGLEAGADDYVPKPVDPRVLAARIKAVLRRGTSTPAGATVEVGSLAVDTAAMRVTDARGDEVRLTPIELRLLLEFVARPGQVFTRELLLQQVWDYDHLGDSRLVDAAVYRLRAKVEPTPAEPRFIRTVRGIGYRLDLQPTT